VAIVIDPFSSLAALASRTAQNELAPVPESPGLIDVDDRTGERI